MGKKGYTCLRTTFCCFNLLIWICGCAFLGAGLWLHLGYAGYATLLPRHDALSAAALFLTVGVLSFIVSFFGYCGSWFQSRCLVFMYIALVVLLFLSEFLLGALVFLFRGGISRVVADELKQGIELHYNSTDRGALAAPSVAAIWDHLQIELQCCGVRSYEDWYDIQAWPNERWVPKSCCRKLESVIIIEGSGDDNSEIDCHKAADPTVWWSHGCGEMLQKWFMDRLHIVGGIALGILVIQLIGLVCSMLLYYTIKYNQSSHTYKSYSPTIDNNPRIRTYSDAE